MGSRTRQAVIILFAFVVGGCVLDGPTNEPRIENESGVSVSVFWLNALDEAHFRDIEPGQGAWVVSYGATCAPNEMVGRRPMERRSLEPGSRCVPATPG